VQRLVDRNTRADTFAVIASEWLELRRKQFAPATMKKTEWTFRDKAERIEFDLDGAEWRIRRSE
jgi:hypothetical protein